MSWRESSPGGRFVLGENESWISKVSETIFFRISVKTDPSAGYWGIKAFIAELATRGLAIGMDPGKLGPRADDPEGRLCQDLYG